MPKTHPYPSTRVVETCNSLLEQVGTVNDVCSRYLLDRKTVVQQIDRGRLVAHKRQGTWLIALYSAKLLWGERATPPPTTVQSEVEAIDWPDDLDEWLDEVERDMDIRNLFPVPESEA